MTRWYRLAHCAEYTCLAVALAATLALPACGQPRATEQDAELKLSTALGPAYAQGKAGEAWAALIRQRSGGRFAVRHYPGATLTQRDPVREFAALRDGSLDFAVGSSVTWSTQVQPLNLLSLPWLIPDEATLETLLAGETGARLSAAIETAGVVPVLLSANGFTALATRQAVHKPSDLAGMNIRAAPSPIMAETLAALGARNSSMSLSDARAAWSSGALDGQETSVAAYATSRMDTMGLAHLLLWDARAEALIFAVNRTRWMSWNEADREMVRSAAREAAREAHALGQRSSDASAVARLGAIVTRLTPEGKAAFRSAVRDVYSTWTPLVGEDLVRDVEAATSAASPR